MQNQKGERRRTNGRRFEGNALAAQVAKEVNGMMLAQAFVTVRSAGFKLAINKTDGIPRQGFVDDTGTKVMVDVVNGYVHKSWTVE